MCQYANKIQWLYLQPVSSRPYIWLINHNIIFFKFNLFSTCSDIDAPSNLAATEVTEDTVTLSWDGVQAEVEGYMLSYVSAEGVSSDIPVGRDRTSYRLIGLKPGVLHNIYVWAFKEDKVSKKTSTEAETGELLRREWNWQSGNLTFFLKSTRKSTRKEEIKY